MEPRDLLPQCVIESTKFFAHTFDVIGLGLFSGAMAGRHGYAL
jgi:hypothetical protein